MKESDNSENFFNEDIIQDDEYIYNPNQESDEINLLDNEFNYREKEPSFGTEELYSKYFSKILNVRIGGFKILPLIGAILGIILVICGFILMGNASQRVIDNVASGEYSVSILVVLALGFVLITVSAMKLFNIKNPLSELGEQIDHIENESAYNQLNINTPFETDTEEIYRPPSEPDFNEIIELKNFEHAEDEEIFDNEEKSYNIEELKKPSSKNIQITLDDIPNAKKTIPNEEIEKEYEKAKLDTESIEDIFSDFDE